MSKLLHGSVCDIWFENVPYGVTALWRTFLWRLWGIVNDKNMCDYCEFSVISSPDYFMLWLSCVMIILWQSMLAPPIVFWRLSPPYLVMLYRIWRMGLLGEQPSFHCWNLRSVASLAGKRIFLQSSVSWEISLLVAQCSDSKANSKAVIFHWLACESLLLQRCMKTSLKCPLILPLKS